METLLESGVHPHSYYLYVRVPRCPWTLPVLSNPKGAPPVFGAADASVPLQTRFQQLYEHAIAAPARPPHGGLRVAQPVPSLQTPQLVGARVALPLQATRVQPLLRAHRVGLGLGRPVLESPAARNHRTRDCREVAGRCAVAAIRLGRRGGLL